jgi:tetratricopeptide (TPR) repeat protein
LGRYFATEDYYAQAIEKFNQGLLLKSSQPLLLHGVALAYFAIGELKDDLEALEKSTEYFAKLAEFGGRLFPQFLSDWGVALMKLGEITNDRSYVEAAAAKFEQVINGRLDAIDGEEVETEWLYNYGCAMDFLGDFHDDPVYYEKAVQVLSHVIKIDPDYIHARYNLALALSHLGELSSDVNCFHNAIEQFHEVVMHDPEDEITWNDYGLALLNLAVLTTDPMDAHRAKGLFEQAEIRLQHAALLGSLHAYYNLACLYALTDNPAAAIHYLEKAEHSQALPLPDDVIHDEWLDGLRDQPAYRLFISRLLNQLDEEF